jgi:hypothetical protein
MIIHFIFHVRCISLHKPLCFIFFCFLLRDISVLWCCHIYQYACFLFFVFNYYIWYFCCNFALLVPLD